MKMHLKHFILLTCLLICIAAIDFKPHMTHLLKREMRPPFSQSVQNNRNRRINLNDLGLIFFYPDRISRIDLDKPVHQMECIGGCEDFIPELIVCFNGGKMEDTTKIDWLCTAPLPFGYKLNIIEINIGYLQTAAVMAWSVIFSIQPTDSMSLASPSVCNKEYDVQVCRMRVLHSSIEKDDYADAIDDNVKQQIIFEFEILIYKYQSLILVMEDVYESDHKMKSNYKTEKLVEKSHTLPETPDQAEYRSTIQDGEMQHADMKKELTMYDSLKLRTEALVTKQKQIILITAIMGFLVIAVIYLIKKHISKKKDLQRKLIVCKDENGKPIYFTEDEIRKIAKGYQSSALPIYLNTLSSLCNTIQINKRNSLQRRYNKEKDKTKEIDRIDILYHSGPYKKSENQCNVLENNSREIDSTDSVAFTLLSPHGWTYKQPPCVFIDGWACAYGERYDDAEPDDLSRWLRYEPYMYSVLKKV